MRPKFLDRKPLAPLQANKRRRFVDKAEHGAPEFAAVVAPRGSITELVQTRTRELQAGAGSTGSAGAPAVVPVRGLTRVSHFIYSRSTANGPRVVVSPQGKRPTAAAVYCEHADVACDS